MSKSYHKKKEEDFDEYNEYGELKQRVIDRRKKRRFSRALKVKDIDELLEYNDEESWEGLP
jgi:uncharacterized protein YpiB (UPF0302 family)